MTKDEAEMIFLFKEAESRQLTKDEVITLFNITRKRIQRLEQKAVLLLYSKRRNPKPEKTKNSRKKR